MKDGERVIAVIPARGGSKAIPKKSIVPFGGMPLLAWPIRTAKALQEIDRIIVSTDDPTIADVARRYGAEVDNRPVHLATDSSLVIDALRDLIARLRAQGETARWLFLLEATAPLRSPDDVRACLERLAKENLDSVATFVAAAPGPTKAWKVTDGRPAPYFGDVDPWAPRQAAPQAWLLNGCVYGFVIDHLPATGSGLLFGNAGAVLMPKDRSLDINDELDLAIGEVLVRRMAESPH